MCDIDIFENISAVFSNIFNRISRILNRNSCGIIIDIKPNIMINPMNVLINKFENKNVNDIVLKSIMLNGNISICAEIEILTISLTFVITLLELLFIFLLTNVKMVS